MYADVCRTLPSSDGKRLEPVTEGNSCTVSVRQRAGLLCVRSWIKIGERALYNQIAGCIFDTPVDTAKKRNKYGRYA